MKTPRWLYVENVDATPTESDAFEQIIVTSMQSAIHPDMYADCLLTEYEELTAAIKRGQDSPNVRRMLARCVRALKKINKL